LHRRRGHDGVPRRPYRQIPAPPEHQITVPVPAIVNEALFASVAEQLAENRRRSRERLAGVRYLLRGLLVCQKCGYGFTGHYHRGRYRYYRCCGTDCSRYHGAFRCDARLVAVEPLDAAVWREVCRLLQDPERVLAEYQRRLEMVSAGPRRLELDVVERQVGRLRRAIDRLIDSYAEGFIDKGEFEPRITDLRRRLARLAADAVALRDTAEQARSLQLVIGKLSLFAEMVRGRLETADWATQRDIICALVKRIEVADDVVRVIFRVEPGSSGPPEPRRILPHCPTRRGASRHVAFGPHVRLQARSRDGTACRSLIRSPAASAVGPEASLPGTWARRFRVECCGRSRTAHNTSEGQAPDRHDAAAPQPTAETTLIPAYATATTAPLRLKGN
jgi:site-specific DNA recombinase